MSKINIKIKIPDEWYAGFTQSRDGLPRVYMTPHGTDRLSKNRAQAIQRYSQGAEGIPDAVMDNKPLCGFKIVKPVNYGYNTGKVVWLIEDPRGFVSEIPSGNMGQLLALTTVDHCEILESCVWARDGKDNVLLPTNSIEYQTAAKNTDLAKQTVNIGKVAIGNIVHLKNGKRNMKYLGKYNEYIGHQRRYSWTKTPAKLSKMAHYYIDTDGVIHSYGNGNVAELVDAKSIMTPAEAEEFINKKMSKILMSVEPNIGVNTAIDLIPLNVPALSVKYANTGGHEPYDNVVMAKMPGNVMAYCDYPHFGRGYRGNGKCELEFREIVQTEWVRGFLTFRTTKSKNRWGNGYSESDIIHTIDTHDIPTDTEFYEIQFTWKTPHGEFKKMRRR